MTQATELELLGLEREYWQAVVHKDEYTTVRLTHDPCVLAGPNGVRAVSHDQLAAAIRSAPVEIRSFSIGDDAVVRFAGPDVAVVAYSIHEDLTRDGTPQTLDAVDTSTWIRRNGRWVCVAHTESIKNQAQVRASGDAADDMNDTLAEVREGLEHLRFGSAVSPSMPDAVEDERRR